MLASGKTVPISSLRPGDKVLAANTKTGKDQPETVTAVEVNHDTDLYDLTVKTPHGAEVIHTTANHLFRDPYHHHWIASNKLSKGEHLKTPDGSLAIADGGTTPKRARGVGQHFEFSIQRHGGRAVRCQGHGAVDLRAGGPNCR